MMTIVINTTYDILQRKEAIVVSTLRFAIIFWITFFKAFGMKETAKRVYGYIVKNNIKY